MTYWTVHVNTHGVVAIEMSGLIKGGWFILKYHTCDWEFEA